MQVLHTLEPPSRTFLAGTDQFGRDQLSRVMWGARRTLAVAVVSTVLGVALGVIVGMVGGYYRGWIDEVLMRLVDALMALPALLLAMLILTTLGSSPVYVVLGIAVVFMPRTARMVRGVALSLGQAEFVDAARLRGEFGAYVIFREMLPNAWAPIIVESAIRFSYAILLATSLGFLGLGAGPPTPDWGLMINEALPFLDQAPWLAILPGGWRSPARWWAPTSSARGSARRWRSARARSRREAPVSDAASRRPRRQRPPGDVPDARGRRAGGQGRVVRHRARAPPQRRGRVGVRQEQPGPRGAGRAGRPRRASPARSATGARISSGMPRARAAPRSGAGGWPWCSRTRRAR